MKRFGIIFFVGLMLSSQVAMAAVSDEDFAQLRADFAQLAQRLEALAAENAQLKQQGQQVVVVAEEAKTQATAAQASADEPSWSDRIRMDGDFRYRFENIEVDGKDGRHRSRIRARTNIRADLPSNVEVGFGLATGGDDPVSANQTLGQGGSSKNIRLNLAYADWNATEGLHLIVGKYKNPLLKVGKQALMWDGDWTPEGLALTYQNGWFFANALGTWLESDSKGGNSSFSWGGQLGAAGNIGSAALKGGVGYFALKTKDHTDFFGDPTDPDDFFGNTAIESGGLACGTTADTICFYKYDYLLTEVFGEAAFQVGSFPTTLFFDYVNNSDPSDDNTAWTVGTRIGQTKGRGQYQFSYYYAVKEADSIFGLLTDSDFAGGGTDNEGHFFKLMVGINKTWSIGGQYFINEIDVISGKKTDYNRLMLDTQWKYK